ncbi:hypothetical protein [Pusillimonas sp.]|uniref:hypothetical protein n=1 Tax=Pusillimonas sp. TaxID=3040095 RepID=UPI0029BCACF2|nr:hypothetical protein [Pusillimonas sp.]MDX3895453.1 hypothetical protein [Pusillimonas sp.]
MIYERAIRPILFNIPPEAAHSGVLRIAGALTRAEIAGEAIRRVFSLEDERLAVSIAGMRFPNPIGLGAGMDKNAIALAFLAQLGFGSLEVGSISLHPSKGNINAPRLLRVPQERALLVNYGVPNDGVDAVAPRLQRHLRRVPLGTSAPLGVSLVETNTGIQRPASAVIEELRKAAISTAPLSDYLTINLQCPNSSVGPFAKAGNLRALLSTLSDIGRMPPTFLKTTATTDERLIDELTGIACDFPFVRGIALSVVMRRHFAIRGEPHRSTMGSVTGDPLRSFALESLRAWYSRIDRRRLILIGAGGISTGAQAYEFIQNGASLTQLVTALVYRGPSVARRIKSELLSEMKRDGIANVHEAIGCAVA